ncbi:MAG: SDR family NAD(P)-dependent oxidoreductase [Ruminococcaceae bacterium]|nr:SDR family NAD(P)-dependent oxidoreductase [Oscillospiraceae bacterium]
MKEFKGKTALITGSAMGFGAEFAKEAARRGMKVAMVDIQQDALDTMAKEVAALGAEVLPICADVSLYEEMQRAVKETRAKFGTIDLLINNAGVMSLGTVWETPIRDMQWIVDTDLMSIIYGMHEVIPVMLEQATPCHIVNVCSIAGFIVNRSMTIYDAAKFAAVAASEATNQDLLKLKADIGMTIFCPGFVQTDLNHPEPKRPARFQAPDDPYYQSEAFAKATKLGDRFLANGKVNEGYAQKVFECVEQNRFYLLTEQENDQYVATRHQNIQKQENPTLL